MPMTPKNDWFVYLHDRFGDAADELSDGAFRLHVSGLCLAAQRRGDMFMPAHRVPRLTPNYRPTQLDELIEIDWWRPEGAGYRIAESPHWMVCRNREGRKSIPRRIRAEVYLRDGHRCVECGARADLTLDHILPYSKGGTDEIANLRTLCRSCNSRKGARV